MNEAQIKKIEDFAKTVRLDILNMVKNANSGHLGGSLSSVEILSVLYQKTMKTCVKCELDAEFQNRDRFILSKGHASPLLYSVLARSGYFDPNELMTFRKLGSRLQGHPCSNLLSCIEASTGSLGQGLSIACGIALGLRLNQNPANIYVLLGDGELQEGSVWEGFMNASHNKLNNITAIIDRNRLQIDGSTEQVKSLEPLAEKLKAFNWNVKEIDGHNIEEINDALELAKNSDKPFCIIANTVKGKGVTFMENNANWHGKCPSADEYTSAFKELQC